MAERPKLTAEVRSEFKKSHTKAIRRDGNVPATVYGSKLDNSVSVHVPLIGLTECVKTEGGANVIIDLEIQGDGGGEALPVMIHEIQRDPRTRKILHADFRAISLDQKVTTTVPIHITGESVGVRDEGGMVDQIHFELTIQALPMSIPSHISVDVSDLHIGDAIRIGDIQVEDAEIMGQDDDPVVMVRLKPMEVLPEEEAVVAEAGGEEAGGESEAEGPTEEGQA